MRFSRLVLGVLCALALAPAASAGTLTVGACEDAAKSVDPVAAQAKMDLAKLAGLEAVRLSTTWTLGQTAPTDDELLALQNATAAARLDGIRPIVSMYQFARNTPTTAAARADWVRWATALAQGLPDVKDFIVGNEPNLNLFWMPQFTGGADAAAPAYEALLADAYDALKGVDPAIHVIGGSVSPRGQDRADSSRQTHSPTTFIPDLGAAYRASGRTKPIMDMFAFHPYGENSSIAPDLAHPKTTSIGLADYPKLVGLLRDAFGHYGATLPIIYDEYGIDSQIPAAKASLYDGFEPPTTHPVSEALQGARYREAITMASCQPNVKLMLIFHVSDEPGLAQWQSGMYYADDTPKPSLDAVRAAAAEAAVGGFPCAAVSTRTPPTQTTSYKNPALVPAGTVKSGLGTLK
jgi:hypothetical protein